MVLNQTVTTTPVSRRSGPGSSRHTGPESTCHSHPKDFGIAKGALNTHVDKMSSAIADGWAEWAKARIDELPQLRLSMLAVDEQAAERERLVELRRLTRIKVPTGGDVTYFATTMAALSEALAQVDDPSTELVALIGRLTGRAIPLADITDDEIALLRRSGVDGQIQLSRRAT